MFEPFPGNYVWNLPINLALLAGGNHGELDAVCRPVREAAARGEEADTALLFDAWTGVARQVLAMAQHDLRRHRRLSPGIKLQRAALYLLGAERVQSADNPVWRATTSPTG